MKSAIMYNYDINNITMYSHNHLLYVKNKDNRYIVKQVVSEDAINEIYYILCKYNKIREYYKIVMTKQKRKTFEYNRRTYALIEINKNRSNVENKILENTKIIKSKYILDRSDWYYLWTKKLDYIITQSNMIRKKYKIIDEIIDYYIGMTETAISYLKNNTSNNESSKRLSICHKKIDAKSIYDPLNIVIDGKERDISEYLKYLFINNIHSTEKIKNIIQKLELNSEEINRLYARMIYPSYFFDIYDKIINQEESENYAIKMIKRIDEYECYLRYIYNEINKKVVELKKIEWL